MKGETPDIFALPVHPAADKFPMMEEEELDELAQDIRDTGLQHPLIIGEWNGRAALIDGRNRREACRRAGCIPETEMLDGQDPVAYIISANINRRHMTKGQRAMAVAMIYPEPEKGGRGKKANPLVSKEFSGARVSQARTVLRHTPDAASLVLTGAMSLDAAYKHAHEVKLSAEGEEGVMQTLRDQAPDLADQVVEGTLSLGEASAALQARQEKEITDRRGVWLVLNSGLSFASSFGNREFPDMSGHWDEFSGTTGNKRLDVLASLERLQRNLPNILASIRNSED